MSAQVVDLDVLDDLVIDLRAPGRRTPDLQLVTELGLAIDLPRTRYRDLVKPVLDRTLAAVLLLAILPVLVTIAVVLRIRLGRGILFRQERIGLGGRPFTVYKFRTMLPDRRSTTGDGWGATDRRRSHKQPTDPRHTRVGQFLRRWSLDELPQLFNVLRGEMSLVGPRPELPHIVDRYEPWEHARHAVRPGLTGFWQTTARAAGPMQEYTHLDIEYVKRLSFATDLRVLCATPFAALGAQKGC
jgi:lipopolysaccharide/colanic/teichoic acid biosynthesis glycosyltransferase